MKNIDYYRDEHSKRITKTYYYDDGSTRTTTYYEDPTGIYKSVEDHKNNKTNYEYKIKTEKDYQKELRKEKIISIIGIITSLILIFPLVLLVGAIFTWIVVPILVLSFLIKLIVVIYASIKCNKDIDDYHMFMDLEDEEIYKLEDQLRNSKLYQKSQNKQKTAPVKEAESLNKTYKKTR